MSDLNPEPIPMMNIEDLPSDLLLPLLDSLSTKVQQNVYLGKPQKKVLFLMVRHLRPFPSPLVLVAIRNFFPYIKKKFFFTP